jgi:diguanylate cyclase (GGDEF)-like protein/PAS domain S-box-containing protein
MSLSSGTYGERPPRDVTFAWDLLNCSPEAIGAISPEGTIEYLNPAAEKLLGVKPTQARGHRWLDILNLFDETGRVRFTAPPSTWTRPGVLPRPPAHLLLRRQGSERQVQLSAAAIGDLSEDPTAGTVVFIRDVAEVHELLLNLTHCCSHDHMTNLVNRQEFEKRLAHAMKKAAARGQQHALLYMDLDRFKAVNDNFGHIAGDGILLQLADCLRAVVRERDTLARLGGDEFGLLMEHCSLEEAGRAARNMHEAVVRYPFKFEEHVFTLGISIGVVRIDSRSKSMADAIAAADAACYLAKRAEHGGIFVRRPE